MLSKNVNNKKCVLKFLLFYEKKSKKSDDFWRRKLTFKVKFRHFLTPPHYTNLQNSMISFDYSWFLAKNLSNFISLPWKLHNLYCHTLHFIDILAGASKFSRWTAQLDGWWGQKFLCCTWPRSSITKSQYLFSKGSKLRRP
jgi:hypothetical protein